MMISKRVAVCLLGLFCLLVPHNSHAAERGFLKSLYCTFVSFVGIECGPEPVLREGVHVPQPDSPASSGPSSSGADTPLRQGNETRTVVERVVVGAIESPAPFAVGVSSGYLESRLAEVAAELRSEMTDRTVPVRSSSGASPDRLSRQTDQIYEDIDDAHSELRGEFLASDVSMRSELLDALASATSSLVAGSLQQGGNGFGLPAVLGTLDSQPLSVVTSGLERLTVTAEGKVGVGTSTPSAKLDVFDSDSVFGTSANTLNVRGLTAFTNTETGSYYRPVAMSMDFVAAPVVAPSVFTDFHGVDIVLRGSNSNLTSLSRLYAFESTANYGGSDSISSLYGGYFQSVNSGPGNVSSATGLRLWSQNTGNGRIDTLRGLYIQNPNNTGSGSIGDNYGIFIEPMTAGGVSNFGIYSLAARNYLLSLTSTWQTINATTTPALVINQASSPGTDSVTFNINHTANFYPFRVANAGAYGPIFTSTLNGGDSLTVRKNGTGAGVVAKLINAGTGNTLEAGPSGNPNLLLTSAGSLGIGTAAPQRRLHVRTSADEAPVRFEDSSGYCEINPVSTAWSCSSDERLKEDVESLDSADVLSKVVGLRPVSFAWRSDASRSQRLGLIAQEVEKIFPDLVNTDERGYKSVSYGGFTTYLISAVKELTHRIELLSRLVTTDKVETMELCVGTACVTESEFLELLSGREHAGSFRDTKEAPNPDTSEGVLPVAGDGESEPPETDDDSHTDAVEGDLTAEAPANEGQGGEDPISL